MVFYFHLLHLTIVLHNPIFHSSALKVWSANTSSEKKTRVDSVERLILVNPFSHKLWEPSVQTQELSLLPLAPTCFRIGSEPFVNNRRSLFEKQKLTGNNFMEWYRNLRNVLSTEDKLPFLEQPIPTLPVPPEGQANPSDVVTNSIKLGSAQKKLLGLSLYMGNPDIQKNPETPPCAYDMLRN
ncbi:hypothetical protein Tco_1185956 [Tanacetum coccineum]